MQPTLLIAALSLGAPALKDPPKKDPDLFGEWVLEQVTWCGRVANFGFGEIYTFTKDGKWLIHHRNGMEIVLEGRGVEINAKADPPHVDLVTRASRRTGIFKIEGDTATLCVAMQDQPRPTAIESTAANRNTIFVLKRKKE